MIESTVFARSGLVFIMSQAHELQPDDLSIERRLESQLPNDFSNARKLWVLLPAFNEEEGIGELLSKIQCFAVLERLEYEIIVVDDSSTDRTAEIASKLSFEMPILLKQHEENLGLAGALRTAFDTVMEVGDLGDVVVTMDGDNTHQPGTIRRMLMMIDEGYDVVIASRYQAGSRTIGVPPHRLAMTSIARFLFKIVTPISGVRDYTCGFRAYQFDALKISRDFYREDFISEQGFSCMADVLFKMRRFNFVMGEVPMLLRYDEKSSVSKMNVAKTAAQTLTLLFKRRFSR